MVEEQQKGILQVVLRPPAGPGTQKQQVDNESEKMFVLLRRFGGCAVEQRVVSW